MNGIFPSLLEIVKVVPVFKKDSKLAYSKYRPISLLSNIEKILEKLMYKRPYTFLDNTNIIYDLQYGFRQQYSTCFNEYNWEYKKSSWWWGYRLWGFCRLAKIFWYCRPSDTVSKIQSLWDYHQYVSINGYESGLFRILYSCFCWLLWVTFINNVVN